MNQDSKMSLILLTTLLLALAADAEYLEADSPHHDKQMDKSNLLKVGFKKTETYSLNIVQLIDRILSLGMSGDPALDGEAGPQKRSTD